MSKSFDERRHEKRGGPLLTNRSLFKKGPKLTHFGRHEGSRESTKAGLYYRISARRQPRPPADKKQISSTGRIAGQQLPLRSSHTAAVGLSVCGVPAPGVGLTFARVGLTLDALPRAAVRLSRQTRSHTSSPSTCASSSWTPPTRVPSGARFGNVETGSRFPSTKGNLSKDSPCFNLYRKRSTN